MKKIQQAITFTVYETLDELSTQERSLMEEAIQMKAAAYAPYSDFSVGAAILLDNGKIIVGSNQENAAFPSGMCAERVAIYSAGAMYPKAVIMTIAIAASSAKKVVDKPVGPCGACRQAIAEYEFKQEKPIQLLFTGEKGHIIKSESLSNLLPLSFDSSFL